MEQAIIAKIEPFEKLSAQYKEWFEVNQFVYESELEAVRVLLPENGKGVEIGEGSARFAAPLEITMGVEPSKESTTQNIIQTIQKKYFDWADMVVAGVHSRKKLFEFRAGGLTRHLIKEAKKTLFLGQ